MQRATRVSPGLWAFAGIWVWAPAILFLWIWTGTQVRLGWWLATVESLSTWAGLVLARWIAIWGFNRLVSSWAPLSWCEEQGSLVRVPVRVNLGIATSMALPFALIVGGVANVFGWTLVIPDRWITFPIGLFLAAVVYAVGCFTLYNLLARRSWRVPISIDPILGPKTAWSHAVHRWFVVVAWLGFLWSVVAILLLWIVGGSLLIVLAGHFPAGWFGFKVEAFAVVSVAFICYWIALLIGAWYALGVRLIQWQEVRRGPFRLVRLGDEVGQCGG